MILVIVGPGGVCETGASPITCAKNPRNLKLSSDAS